MILSGVATCALHPKEFPTPDRNDRPEGLERHLRCNLAQDNPSLRRYQTVSPDVDEIVSLYEEAKLLQSSPLPPRGFVVVLRLPVVPQTYQEYPIYQSRMIVPS